MKLLLAALLLASCATMPETAGIPNLRQVAPGAYRSGQPTTPEQWSYLRGLGVETALKLDCANEGGGNGDIGAGEAGMRVLRLCLHPRTDGFGLVELFRGPSDAQLLELDNLARAIAADPDPRVLIHCVNGRERTGILAGMVVRYRLHYSRGQAYRYMLDTGFRPLAIGASWAWKRWNERIFKE